MPSGLPPLNALRAFDAIVRSGSVTQAAVQLHVTTSAVSHLLHRLEEDLGLELFHREAGRLVLTTRGRAYHADIGAAFERIAAATERLVQETERPVVQVTAMPAFAIQWLVPRLADFYATHRDIDVRVGVTTRVVDIDATDDDLAIRFGAGAWPNATAERLFRETVEPVVHPRLLRRARATPREILALPRIHQTLDRDHWHGWASAYGLDASSKVRSLRFDEPLGALRAALDGQGVMLAPRALVHADLVAGRLVAPLAEPLALIETYYLVTSRRAPETVAAAAFKRWLLAAAKQYEREAPKAKGKRVLSAMGHASKSARASAQRG